MSGERLEQRLFASGSASSCVHTSGSNSSISTYSPDRILLTSFCGTGGRPSPTYVYPFSLSCFVHPAFASAVTVAASCVSTRVNTLGGSSEVLECSGMSRSSVSFGTSTSPASFPVRRSENVANLGSSRRLPCRGASCTGPDGTLHPIRRAAPLTYLASTPSYNDM